MVLAGRVASQHRPREQGRTGVAQIESGGADLGEADRRQVDLAGQLDEPPGADLVDFEPGKAIDFAVAFLGPVIDVIVAERAEVEASERALGLAAGNSGMGVNPRRSVGDRQWTAIIETEQEFGEAVAVGEIRRPDRAPGNAFFTIDPAE